MERLTNWQHFLQESVVGICLSGSDGKKVLSRASKWYEDNNLRKSLDAPTVASFVLILRCSGLWLGLACRSLDTRFSPFFVQPVFRDDGESRSLDRTCNGSRVQVCLTFLCENWRWLYSRVLYAHFAVPGSVTLPHGLLGGLQDGSQFRIASSQFLHFQRFGRRPPKFVAGPLRHPQRQHPRPRRFEGRTECVGQLPKRR